MRHYEGMSLAQIAKVVGRSEGAIRAGYFHAVRKLRVAARVGQGHEAAKGCRAALRTRAPGVPRPDGKFGIDVKSLVPKEVPE